MNKIKNLGSMLKRNEQKLISGGINPEDDEMIPKTSCSCQKANETFVGPFLCGCGYEEACINRKCGTDKKDWVCHVC